MSRVDVGGAPSGAADSVRLSDRDFHDLRDVVLAETGINLTEAKRHLLCARLARRLRALRLSSFTEYHRVLQSPEGDGERLEMVDAITTNKTDFFREATTSTCCARW